jgi:hypothetical protein
VALHARCVQPNHPAYLKLPTDASAARPSNRWDDVGYPMDLLRFGLGADGGELARLAGASSRFGMAAAHPISVRQGHVLPRRNGSVRGTRR